MDVQGTSKAKLLSILLSAEIQWVKNDQNILLFFSFFLEHKLERQSFHYLLMYTKLLP
jgi:hypothetical protein